MTGEKKIFRVLLEKYPLTLSQISREAGLKTSLVQYHLPRMIIKGIVLKKKQKYELQPFFYSELYDELVEDIDKIIKRMASYVYGDCTDNGVWEVMRNNLLEFIHTLSYQ